VRQCVTREPRDAMTCCHERLRHHHFLSLGSAVQRTYLVRTDCPTIGPVEFWRIELRRVDSCATPLPRSKYVPSAHVMSPAMSS
jgi:hypothetical protein